MFKFQTTDSDEYEDNNDDGVGGGLVTVVTTTVNYLRIVEKILIKL